MSLPRITNRQLLLRLQQVEKDGRVALSGLDLREINMQEPDLRKSFQALFERDTAILPYIDMTGSDISGLDFSFYDLTRVILSYTRAKRTVFFRADLSDTQFDHAIADSADFRLADLYHTKFYQTSLERANFTNAKIEFARGIDPLFKPKAPEAMSKKPIDTPLTFKAMRERLEEKIRERKVQIAELMEEESDV